MGAGERRHLGAADHNVAHRCHWRPRLLCFGWPMRVSRLTRRGGSLVFPISLKSKKVMLVATITPKMQVGKPVACAGEVTTRPEKARRAAEILPYSQK